MYGVLYLNVSSVISVVVVIERVKDGIKEMIF